MFSEPGEDPIISSKEVSSLTTEPATSITQNSSVHPSPHRQLTSDSSSHGLQYPSSSSASPFDESSCCPFAVPVEDVGNGWPNGGQRGLTSDRSDIGFIHNRQDADGSEGQPTTLFLPTSLPSNQAAEVDHTEEGPGIGPPTDGGCGLEPDSISSSSFLPVTTSHARNFNVCNRAHSTQSTSHYSRSFTISTTEEWLLDQIEISPLMAISKSSLKSKYESFCVEIGMRPVVPETLKNKILKHFPSVTIMGQRSQLSFYGIGWKKDFTGNAQVAEPENFGVTLAHLRSSKPTLRHCPKGARREVAILLAEHIERVVSQNSCTAWKNLFILPYHLLAVPKKDEKVNNLTSWLKTKVTMIRSPDMDNLHIPIASRPKKNRKSNFRKSVESKLAEGDTRGAIRLLTTDDTFAPDDDATFQSLLLKHPTHPIPTKFPVPPDSPDRLVLEAADISKSIRTFACGTAGGLDSLRPQLLKELTSLTVGDAGDRLLTAITNLTNLITVGILPEEIRPIFFGAALVVVQKKSGGIRPIAIGNTWRRLAAKAILAKISTSLTQYLSPTQLGVGVQGGAEAAAHAARINYNHQHTSAKVMLKVDFFNAFNQLRRDSLLQEVKQHVPSVYHFISQSYQADSDLFFGSKNIKSQLGVQQGDPLGPALFALTIHPLATSIDTELNSWFLDDGIVADSPEQVLSAFKHIATEAQKIGLELNFQKCEICVLGANESSKSDIIQLFADFAPDIKVFENDEAELLGAPLSAESTRKVLKAKTECFQKYSSKLSSLSAHAAFFLLRLSISTPRLIYFLRCSPSFRELDLLQSYDDALKSALEQICNLSFSSQSWDQSSLPVAMGGLGVRHAVDTAISSFLASVHSVNDLIGQILPSHISWSDDAAVEATQAWIQGGLEVPIEENKKIQHHWEFPKFTKLVDAITLDSNEEDKARILAASCPHSGEWLSVLPSPQLGTLLSDECFRISTAIRIGGEICVPHTCPCGSEVAATGYHGLSCKRSAGRLSRHSAINDIIQRALRTAEVPSMKEPVGCSRTDGRKPDGLTLIPWKQGKPLCWDFTCRDTFAPTYLKASAARPGHAAALAELDKHRLYEDLEERYLFVAVAVETTGVFGEEGLKLIKKIGQKIRDITGEPRSTNYLLQRISVALQRGNTASVLGTIPPGKELKEIFYL